MKKMYQLSLWLGLASCLAACQVKLPVQSSMSTTQTQIHVSNLLDEKSQTDLKDLLIESLPVVNVGRFLDQVLYYNELVANDSMVQTGYELLADYKRPYASGEIVTSWTAKEPIFLGFNCRLTTYSLLKDQISFDPHKEADESLLFIDQVALESATQPAYQFNPQEIDSFKLLFSAIQTDLGKTPQAYMADIQAYYQAQGIQFDLKETSMISVWFLDDLETDNIRLFVGHVGVLVKDGTGYRFIEKLSFEEPYQVLTFQSKAALNTYLMQSYEEKAPAVFKPLIFENDHILDQYQVLYPAK